MSLCGKAAVTAGYACDLLRTPPQAQLAKWRCAGKFAVQTQPKRRANKEEVCHL